MERQPGRALEDSGRLCVATLPPPIKRQSQSFSQPYSRSISKQLTCARDISQTVLHISGSRWQVFFLRLRATCQLFDFIQQLLESDSLTVADVDHLARCPGRLSRAQIGI